jgi:hypothetical protein
MNYEQINIEETTRLNNLIGKETDRNHKACLSDDLQKLEDNPRAYWDHYDPKVFQPGDIIETQRKNTIIAMQGYYSG